MDSEVVFTIELRTGCHGCTRTVFIGRVHRVNVCNRCSSDHGLCDCGSVQNAFPETASAFTHALSHLVRVPVPMEAVVSMNIAITAPAAGAVSADAMLCRNGGKHDLRRDFGLIQVDKIAATMKLNALRMYLCM